MGHNFISCQAVTDPLSSNFIFFTDLLTAASTVV